MIRPEDNTFPILAVQTTYKCNMLCANCYLGDMLNNPKFAETITRDQRGFLLSFADPLAFGKADEELYELVTLELKQRNFIQKYSVKFDTEFNFF